MAANPTCRLKVRWYIWLNRRTSQVTLCATCCSINFHLKQLSTKVIRLKVENRTPSSLIPRRILLKFFPKKLLLHAVGSSATRFGKMLSSLLWQTCYVFELIFIVANGQISKKINNMVTLGSSHVMVKCSLIKTLND